MIEDENLCDEYYAALVRRDGSYLGTFVVGVTSTGICCLPTCRARKPKRVNTRFYRSLGDALGAGFRACKICRPTAAPDAVHADFTAALALLDDPDQPRWTDAALRDAGLSPDRLRRYCKSQYGMTFQALQRERRLACASAAVREGRGYTAVAHEAGYESVSGLADGLRRVAGRERDAGAGQLYLRHLPSPLGPLLAAATEEGVCVLGWDDREDTHAKLASVTAVLEAHALHADHLHLDTVARELDEYFAGTSARFTVPLHLVGTGFRQNTWRALADVAHGTTVSYGDLARRLGDARAVRAVAAANGANAIAVVVPCHRVVSADGALTGYAGGLARKRWLLGHEAGQGRMF